MNRIKLLRLENGVKQAELAKYLNVAPNTLSQWETDKFEPDFINLKKIAEYFNTTTDYILGLSDDPTPPKKIKQSEKEKEGENMKNEDLDGKPVTQSQFNKVVKNLATKDDISELRELLRNYLDTEFNSEKKV